MSALERVIAEHQAKIDGLQKVVASQSKSIETVFTRHNELFEKFGELIDAQIPDKSDEGKWNRYAALKWECRHLMTEAGFCCHCRNFVCECDDE